MKRTIMLLTLFPLLFFAASGFADCGKCGPDHGKHGKHGQYHKGLGEYKVHWKDMDTNGDDALSWEEFNARFANKERSVFDSIDVDKSGSLSHDEWHQFKKAHGFKGHHKKYHKTDLPDPGRYMVHMGDIDKNSDDALSWEEFGGYFASGDRKIFDAIDLDQNGTLSHDEWHQFKKAHGRGCGYKHKE